MVCVQKARLSIFSYWLIMESKQNWPDLGSPISKFRIYILWILLPIASTESLNVIGHWVWLWRALKRILRWGHLTWPGDMTLSDLDLKFSQHVRKRCMNRCAKTWGGAVAALALKLRWGTRSQARGGRSFAVLTTNTGVKKYYLLAAS